MIIGITIIESLRFRLFLVFLYLLVCALGWVFLVYVVPMCEKQKIALLLLAFILFYSSIPLFAKGCYDTRDMAFHLKRIGSLAEGMSWSFPVRYQPNAANGFGYVEHIFYPNLFLYFPAFLYMLDVPLYLCYKIYLFAMNAATCGVAYWSFKRIFSSEMTGILGTGIYSLAIYRIFNLYGLNAAGEVSAKIFFPLLCYGLWKISRWDKAPRRFTEYLPLIISGAGIVCSHVLTWELLFVFLSLFFLLNWRIYLRKDTLLALGVCGAIVFLCCAFFLLPFLDALSMDMAINEFKERECIIKYAISISTAFRTAFEDKDSARTVGNVFLIGAVMFLACHINRKKWSLQKTQGFLMTRRVMILGVLAFWMCTDMFPWNYIPYISKRLSWILSIVQFPWRYLSIVMILMTLVTCYAANVLSEKLTRSLPKWTGKAVLAGISVGLIGISILEISDYMGNYVLNSDIVRPSYMNHEINYTLGLRDYVPEDVHSGDFETNEFICSADSVTVSGFHMENGEKYCYIKNMAGEAYIDLPIFCYEQMRVDDVESGQAMKTCKGVKGRLRVNVPEKYEGEIKIYFKTPFLWHIAEAVSLLSWLACGAVIYRERKIFKVKEKNFN